MLVTDKITTEYGEIQLSWAAFVARSLRNHNSKLTRVKSEK